MTSNLSFLAVIAIATRFPLDFPLTGTDPTFLLLILLLFSIVRTLLEIKFAFVILLEVIKNVTLPELEPIEIDIWTISVLLDGPPRPVCFEEGLDEGTIVALADK